MHCGYTGTQAAMPTPLQGRYGSGMKEDEPGPNDGCEATPRPPGYRRCTADSLRLDHSRRTPLFGLHRAGRRAIDVQQVVDRTGLQGELPNRHAMTTSGVGGSPILKPARRMELLVDLFASPRLWMSSQAI